MYKLNTKYLGGFNVRTFKRQSKSVMDQANLYHSKSDNYLVKKKVNREKEIVTDLSNFNKN